MKFKHMEIKELNNRYGLNLIEQQNDNGDFYGMLLEKIDNSDKVSYFSASFDEKDVVEDVENEKPNLSLELIEINSVYIALY